MLSNENSHTVSSDEVTGDIDEICIFENGRPGDMCTDKVSMTADINKN
jgi:hypothetical protein